MSQTRLITNYHTELVQRIFKCDDTQDTSLT